MMGNKEKLQEEIKKLVNEVTEISSAANENGWTDDDVKKHDGLYNKIQEKKKAIDAISKQEELEKEFSTPVNKLFNRDVEVKETKEESKEALYENTAEIFRGLVQSKDDPNGSSKRIQDAQRNLFQGGHYKGFKNSVEAFTTLTDPKGGIFLPTSISDQIMDISREYGVLGANSLSVPLGPGSTKIPGVTGTITFHAANEGNEVNASRFTFKGINLEALKWMAFVPWTNEISSGAGAKIMPIIMRKIAEAVAGIKDNAVINGDGTSTYHNLTGFLTRAGDATFPEVGFTTAASGNTSFATIDEDDFNNATLSLAPSLRSSAIFVLHPDWRVRLANIKDDNGRPLYLSGGAISKNGDMDWTIFGYRTLFSEHAPNTDGTSEEYGILYNPNYLAFGDGGAFSSELLTEASIKDEDGNRIYLAGQDMQALRVKMYMDFEMSQLTISSGGSNKGAFTVLRTSGS